MINENEFSFDPFGLKISPVSHYKNVLSSEKIYRVNREIKDHGEKIFIDQLVIGKDIDELIFSSQEEILDHLTKLLMGGIECSIENGLNVLSRKSLLYSVILYSDNNFDVKIPFHSCVRYNDMDKNEAVLFYNSAVEVSLLDGAFLIFRRPDETFSFFLNPDYKNYMERITFTGDLDD